MLADPTADIVFAYTYIHERPHQLSIPFHFGDQENFTPYMVRSLSPLGGARKYSRIVYFLVKIGGS